MAEKHIENSLCEKLREALNDPSILRSVAIQNSSSDVSNLFDLIREKKYEIVQDHSGWNQNSDLMKDITGGMTPDVVLRSLLSGQNRIYIEVKERRGLGYGIADSQIIRYFLHLLAMTNKKPKGREDDIRRAVLLAAPSSWFRRAKNAEAWNHFITTFKELSKHFEITLGVILRDQNL